MGNYFDLHWSVLHAFVEGRDLQFSPLAWIDGHVDLTMAVWQETVPFPKLLGFFYCLDFVAEARVLDLEFKNFVHVKVRWLKCNLCLCSSCSHDGEWIITIYVRVLITICVRVLINFLQLSHGLWQDERSSTNWCCDCSLIPSFIYSNLLQSFKL